MRSNTIRLLTGSLLAGATVLTLILPARAQMDQDWSKITFKTQKLSPTLTMIEGVGGFAGGNVAVLAGDDGLLLVDASFPQLGDKLKATLAKISPKPVKMVLNTHFHGDHTAGNLGFGDGATIIAQKNARRRLETDGFGDGSKAPRAALPLVLIDDRLELAVNGEAITVTHYPPAHTDTDVIVRFGTSNVVHLGDLFFNGFYPFIDVQHGGSVKGYVADVERALAELPAGAKIIPGHGPLGERKDLEAFLAMLKDTTGIVEKGIAAGKSAADLKKAKVFAKYDGKWSKGFLSSDDFLDSLYAGLAKK